MLKTKNLYICKLCPDVSFRYFVNICDHLSKEHQIHKKELNVKSMKKYINIQKNLFFKDKNITSISNGIATENVETPKSAFPLE